MRLLLLGLLVAASLDAQPYAFYPGIVNAASFRPPGLPDSGIALAMDDFGRRHDLFANDDLGGAIHHISVLENRVAGRIGTPTAGSIIAMGR